jgi:hypothetical protein
LIISEYIEGSSYNKAIEIFNGTGETVNLGEYSLEKDSNGNENWGNTYNFSGTLIDGDVFVLANSGADQAILDAADILSNGVINFNGDDQIRLLKNGVEIDRIGIPGDISFGQDVTYVREPDAVFPQSGPQDPRSNGEWIEYSNNTFLYLGSHSAVIPTISIISPNGAEEWERGNAYDILWNSSDFTDDVKIELYKDSSTQFTELVAATANDGIWEWSIPVDLELGYDYKIKISEAVTGNPSDISDDFFYITGSVQASGLFISEYIEGSSFNKAVEIFNGTGSAAILSDYSIKLFFNGAITPGQTYPLSGNLPAGDVYVFSHTSADNMILNLADEVSGNFSFNGDDATGLYYNDVLIDCIGEIGDDPGTAWIVAGENSGTKDHTLIRKSEILTGNTDWQNSAGTDETNSEWIVNDIDDFSNLGFHSFGQTNTSPVISYITINPVAPTDEDEVVISADISDVDGSVISATIYWGTDSIVFDHEIEMVVNRENYTTSQPIPIQAQGITVFYYIHAVDNDNATTTSAVNSYSIAEDPDEYSIYDIQGQVNDSPFDDLLVTTRGIVTAVDDSGYFIQDGESAWTGIFVVDTGNTPTIGDSIMFSGEVNEYFDLTVIGYITDFITLSSGNGTPDPIILSTNELNSEQYESVLIQAAGVCDSENPDDPNNYGEWSINDGSGSIRVDDFMFDFDPALNENYQVTGPLYYSYGNYKIVPRDGDDISIPVLSLDAPENITISITNDVVTISWDAVQNATQYKILKNNNLETGWESAEVFITTDLFWSENAGEKTFYKVIAENY